MSDKVGIIVTSRVESSRVPAKALRKIGGKTCFQILVENLQRQKDYPIIAAIPSNTENDVLAEIAEELFVNVHRYQNGSALHHLHSAAKAHRLDHVVRVTQDDILMDAIQMKHQVNFHLKRGLDYTWNSKMPKGTAGEVISFRALDDVVRTVGETPVEFISYYLRKPELYSLREYYPPYEYQFNFRLELDYEEDLRLLNVIYSMLAHPIGTLDIINLLKKKENKHLLDINRLPTVSVYTCCFNQGEFIPDALDSIKGQSYQDFELIIIDDCSTDDSASQINQWLTKQPESFQQRTRVYRFDKNRGLPAASNYAVMKAKGRYVVRLDSDDVLDPAFLQVMVDRAEADHSIGAVFCAYRTVDEKGGTIQDKVENSEYHPGCCLMVKRCVHDVMYKEGLEHFEGLEFFKRFKKSFNYERIPDVLWSYRQHPKSKSKNNLDEREKIKAEI